MDYVPLLLYQFDYIFQNLGLKDLFTSQLGLNDSHIFFHSFDQSVLFNVEFENTLLNV